MMVLVPRERFVMIEQRAIKAARAGVPVQTGLRREVEARVQVSLEEFRLKRIAAAKTKK